MRHLCVYTYMRVYIFLKRSHRVRALLRGISCHTCEWVMSHIWMSHGTHNNESRHTYEWVTAHVWLVSLPRCLCVYLCVYTYMRVYVFLYRGLCSDLYTCATETSYYRDVYTCKCAHTCKCIHRYLMRREIFLVRERGSRARETYEWVTNESSHIWSSLFLSRALSCVRELSWESAK